MVLTILVNKVTIYFNMLDSFMEHWICKPKEALDLLEEIQVQPKDHKAKLL